MRKLMTCLIIGHLYQSEHDEVSQGNEEANMSCRINHSIGMFIVKKGVKELSKE